ncbi:S-layer homology domain-containing protein [Bacillus aerolatus]|uniref:S-layer homology domain-containing protein n=1 Tax=Bacillus aerolatus TaxID=2653354 RepID=A0A6I1FKZ0_9BACI|nr:S-layer homology domain-containing protein [Bacillus aerolatus]KAB7707424.1 S-layer homology domain-containing protein [Bacillus aerolatus]
MKKCLSFLAVFVLAFSSFSFSVKAAAFADLSENHRFYKEMSFLENKGIISGYPDDTFRPDGEVTRAAAAIMIGRALGLNGVQRATKFSDVGADQKASGYIASAVERGIISGFQDGKYHPNEFVTRGQMAIFLSRAFKLTEEAAAPFSDVSSSMTIYPHVKRIIAENLTSGYEDNTFRPNVKVTRAQFSAFLARALDDKFKVELPVQLTYLKNKNKIYHYQSDEMGNLYYKFSGKKYFEWDLWDVYVKNKKAYSIVEKENSQGYYFGYPESESWQLLKYPVKVGQSWSVGYQGYEHTYKITSTTMTITTPAGTFRNVIEVTADDGGTDYYAPNVGLIKVSFEGITKIQLTKIVN